MLWIFSRAARASRMRVTGPSSTPSRDESGQRNICVTDFTVAHPGGLPRLRRLSEDWANPGFGKQMGGAVLFLHRFELFDHPPKFAQSDVLDLPDAFACNAEFLADFFQSFFVTAIESETVAQNRRFAGI